MPGPLWVAEAVQLLTPTQMQTVTPDLCSVLVPGVSTNSSDWLTWATTVDVQACRCWQASPTPT
ncbi:hypothetical protein GCM10022631_28730 [Deinococcus rubellus]|uniref:Uncharacterized protein n=1 Tax=Deinococcus rubellus TaxID=1889240 RepID=A0ABY5YJL1_9DEIO|nr:hypothetical protein [Deinococcus rubellus]UWX65309.1 hypothetical protein N0D28_06560 [Deinococcus rubellus]